MGWSATGAASSKQLVDRSWNQVIETSTDAFPDS
jgi:hypothetical protein